MKKRRVYLNPVTDKCSMVELPGMYAKNPIGRVCRVDTGWVYFSFPSIRTDRGPVRTKARAILSVVRDYKSWIGVPGVSEREARIHSRGWK